MIIHSQFFVCLVVLSFTKYFYPFDLHVYEMMMQFIYFSVHSVALVSFALMRSVWQLLVDSKWTPYSCSLLCASRIGSNMGIWIR